ncbi:DNA-processing protein DprA [Enterococcus sp. HY326]|uniref:DNA-processing protein DprA n=1 Tax=Enterococcus sp. HY326 TaxID=2971265 RepID=UPI00223EFA58|nr:DNA-processing protein DprA [Enterococcus sp. HY326]
MLKELKKLVLQLVYCRGIGNLGRLKVLRFCLANETTQLSLYEIQRIARIEKYRLDFYDSWPKAQIMAEKNQRPFFTILDEEYPLFLQEIYNPPSLLFYQGNLDFLKTPALAIVGTRDASEQAGKVVQQVLPELIEHNFTIVSGLAKGVDSLAHKLTVTKQGRTIAVVGCGLDRTYPKENYYLQKKLAEEHLILSEYPDGTQPLRYHFPMRNRIIAGLTVGTCVVEARQRSGSLITAQMALDFGREVFAFPGACDNPRATGCLQLLQEGAKCVISTQDILDELTPYL